MSDLFCTAKRIGDYESRTEEYEISFAVDDAAPRLIQIKYRAARAYEIHIALEACVEAARAVIAEANPTLAHRPTDESLSQFSWKTLQSVKYDEGASRTAVLGL